MKRLIFRLLFWVLWPLTWFYAPLRVRPRVLVVAGNSCLVVQPYFGGGKWQLPGGGVHFNETYKQAARRELFEEVCIHVDSITNLLPLAVYKEYGLLLRYPIYVARIDSQLSTTLSHELLASQWVSLTSTDSRQLLPHARQAIRAYHQAHLLQ